MTKRFATMPRYKVYKDSGVEWIEDIPEQWRVFRFRYMFTFSKGLNITKENLQETGTPCVNYGEIHSQYGFEVDPYKHPLKCVDSEYLVSNPKSLLSMGDFVFADTSEDIEGSGNFTQLVDDETVFAGYHTVIARPIGDNIYRYLAYVIDSTSFRNQIRKAVKGVKVFSITKTILKDTCIWLANHLEQAAIANFLDQKTPKIDQAIAIKEKQITLLKERKQILIQNAVTCGLNPDAPMRDSGVEWIGEIPAHWDIKRLRFLGNTKNGISAGADYFGSGYPFVSYGDVYNNRELPITVKGLAQSSDVDREQYSIKKGDVLFTRTSETIEEIGFASTCLTTIENATFAGFLIRFRPKMKKLFDGFSKFYFNAPMLRQYFVKEMNLVIRASLSQELLKNLPILLPPLDEQKTIYDYIENETTNIDKAITLQQQQIEKLKEYKTTLINSAVTGKICVYKEAST